MTTLAVGKFRFLIVIKVNKMIKSKVFAILMCAVSLVNAQEINDTTIEFNNSYVIRVAPHDTNNYVNLYGISLGVVHKNKVAKYSGLAINFAMGYGSLFGGKGDNNISINGINISLIITETIGTINGISFGGFFGSYAEACNGISIGVLIAGSKNQNGISIGGFTAGSNNGNGIQVGGISGQYCNFNGLGIAALNHSVYDCTNNQINGIILGIYNDVNVKGISFGLVNNGNSWLQIGLVNMGNSTVQIGLVNLDENYIMGIPIINVNF